MPAGTYSLSHLLDQVLLRNLAAVVDRERGDTAEVLAHLAEVDERKLYLPAAYPSMYAYCVHELHMCEQAALKGRDRAATGGALPAAGPACPGTGRVAHPAPGSMQLSPGTVASPAPRSKLAPLAPERFALQVTLAQGCGGSDRGTGGAPTRSGACCPWLRQLGFRADEARRAADACDAIPDASLEERLRFSLRFLAPRCRVEKDPVMAT